MPARKPTAKPMRKDMVHLLTSDTVVVPLAIAMAITALILIAIAIINVKSATLAALSRYDNGSPNYPANTPSFSMTAVDQSFAQSGIDFSNDSDTPPDESTSPDETTPPDDTTTPDETAAPEETSPPDDNDVPPAEDVDNAPSNDTTEPEIDADTENTDGNTVTNQDRVKIKHNRSTRVIVNGEELPTSTQSAHLRLGNNIIAISKNTNNKNRSRIIYKTITRVGLGDIDGDGTVTIRDVIVVMTNVNKKSTKSTADVLLSDLTGDGKVTAVDFRETLKRLNTQYMITGKKK